MNLTNKANIAAIISCLIWSSAVLVCHQIALAFGARTGAGIECLVGAVVLLTYSGYKGELNLYFKHSIRYYIICGTTWIINWTFFWLAIGRAQSGEDLVIIGLINYLWPSLTLLLSIFILKNRFKLTLFPAVILSFVGVIIAKFDHFKDFGNSEDWLVSIDYFAYLYALCGAISWALYSNYSKKLSHPTAKSGIVCFMFVGGIFLIIMGRFVAEPIDFNITNLTLLLIWSLLTCTAILFWDFAMIKGNVSLVSSFSMLIPIISTLITCFFQNVIFSPMIILGAVVVFIDALGAKLSIQEAEH